MNFMLDSGQNVNELSGIFIVMEMKLSALSVSHWGLQIKITNKLNVLLTQFLLSLDIKKSMNFCVLFFSITFFIQLTTWTKYTKTGICKQLETGICLIKTAFLYVRM